MQPDKGRRIRLVIFLAGAATLIAITLHAGMEPVLHALAALKVSGLAIITLLHLPVIALMGVAWWFIGRPGARASTFVTARLVRDSVAEALPFSQVGGFVGGVRLLVLTGSHALDAALTLFADLVAEFGTKLVYTLAGLLVLAWLAPHATLLRPFSLTLAGALLAASLLVLLRKQFRTMLSRLALWTMRKTMPDSHYAERDFARIFTPAHILPSLAIHAVCWVLGAVEAWITFRLMGLDVSLGQALVVDSLGTAFRTLGFLVPGALGVQEAGYVIVCALFGITPAQAMAFSLVRRARDLLIGLAGLGLWQTLEIRKAALRCDQSGSAKL